MRTAIIRDYDVNTKSKTIRFNWYDPEDCYGKDENYYPVERHTSYCMEDIRQKRMYLNLLKRKDATAKSCVDGAFNLRSRSMERPFLARWSKVHEQWVFE